MSTDNTETLTPLEKRTFRQRWRSFWSRDDDVPTLVALLGMFAIAGLLAWLLVAAFSGGNADQVVAQGPNGGPPPDACPERWRQVDHEEVDNDLHRIFVDGLRGATGQQVDQLKKRMRTDARVLSLMESAFVDPDAVDWQALIEDNCLNQNGRDLFNQVVGVMSASRASQGQAPANGINSGMTPEGPVVASSTGITGDRTSLKFVLPSGKVVHILVRCGNAVFEEKPPIPEGPTDEPEEPTTTTTTTTTVPPTTTTTTTTTTVPCPPDSHREGGRCVKDDQSFDEQQNSDGPPQREPQDVEPPQEEQRLADEAPPEPPRIEDRPPATGDEPEPRETAGQAPDTGGSSGGDTGPDGSYTPNEQPSEDRGVNDPDQDAGSVGSDEPFSSEPPAQGDPGGF